MYVCMSVCVFVCLPVGLSVSVCLFVCVCLLPLSTNPSLSRPLSISACMSLSHLCLSVSAPCPSMCICHSLSFSMYVGPVCMYVCLFLSLSLSLSLSFSLSLHPPFRCPHPPLSHTVATDTDFISYPTA